MHPFLERKNESKQENATHIVCYLIQNTLIQHWDSLMETSDYRLSYLNMQTN